jgi:death-on-curing protein
VTDFLDLEDALEAGRALGAGEVRDLGLLDSALHRPRAAMFGQEAYPTLHEKAAALLESLVRNHPMVDGNKRLGWTLTKVFYRLNGYHLVAPHGPAFDLVMSTAAGRLELTDIARALASWAVPVED